MGSLGCGDDGSAGSPDSGILDAGPDADPACAATGSQTAGPYYPGEPATRMNIVEDRQGVALELTLTVLATGSCEALAKAEVDVWTADSSGDYSGYQVFDTVGATWLRGQQITSASGMLRRPPCTSSPV